MSEERRQESSRVRREVGCERAEEKRLDELEEAEREERELKKEGCRQQDSRKRSVRLRREGERR